MSDLFTVAHVAQLHEIQKARLRRNLPGIGLHVEGLIRRLTDGGVLKTSPGRVIDIRNKIEMLIQAGWHKHTNFGEGMEASAYRKLWPRSVVQPPEYAHRFNDVLLVDRTITLDAMHHPFLLDKGYCAKCRNLVEPPKNKDGEHLARYVAFVKTHRPNSLLSASAFRENMADDEVGLATFECHNLIIQFRNFLHGGGCGLLGSTISGDDIPVVSWGKHQTPSLEMVKLARESKDWRFITRGQQVAPVTNVFYKETKESAWEIIRLEQIRNYLDAGFDDELGLKRAEYFDTIPEVPEHLRVIDSEFPMLVLIDPRLGLVRTCELTGIKIQTDEIVDKDELDIDPSQPFWVRVKHRPISEGERLGAGNYLEEPGEDILPSTALIGICTHLHYSLSLAPVEYTLDLDGSYLVGEKAARSRLVFEEDGSIILACAWITRRHPHWGWLVYHR